MTVSAISRRVNVPIDIVAKAIEKLKQPDPHSRSQVSDGRRLIPIDKDREWGWIIVNYEYYRKLRDADALRTSARDRKRAQRSLESQNVTQCHAPSQNVLNVLHSDSPSDSPSDSKSTLSQPAPSVLELEIPEDGREIKKIEKRKFPDPIITSNMAAGKAWGWKRYNRRETTQLSEHEKRLLFEVAKRPDFIEELKEIQSYAERKGSEFFSNCFETALSRWQQNLDAARKMDRPNQQRQLVPDYTKQGW